MSSEASKAIAGPALFTNQRYLNGALIQVKIYSTRQPKQFLFQRQTFIYGVSGTKDRFDINECLVNTEEHLFETVNGSRSQEAIIAGLRKYRNDRRHQLAAAKEIIDFDVYQKE